MMLEWVYVFNCVVGIVKMQHASGSMQFIFIAFIPQVIWMFEAIIKHERLRILTQTIKISVLTEFERIIFNLRVKSIR